MITIQILEVPAKNRLLVSWRESGLCNYSEQVWALRKAAQATCCAYSGRAIQRGDTVYRPIGSPMNQETCILAEALELPAYSPAKIEELRPLAVFR